MAKKQKNREEWEEEVLFRYAEGKPVKGNFNSELAVLVPGYHSPEEIDREIVRDFRGKRER